MNVDGPTLWDSPPVVCTTSASFARIRDFLPILIQRYRAQMEQSTAALDTEIAAQRLAELYLAEATLRYALLDGPPQIGVFGPTQTGKSTIVNLLFGGDLAEVSPLAGFTVHPQGFWLCEREPPAPWLAALFPGRQRREIGELSRNPDRLDEYAFTRPARGGAAPALPACVLWDTPDFDSLAARGYARGVWETAALADVHLIVLSKEKYADLSVWKMLRLIRPLSRPLVICLNKITPDALEPITAALRLRLSEIGYDTEHTPIVAVEYEPALLASSDLAARPERAALRGALISALSRRPTDKAAGIIRLVRSRWNDWVTPIRAELAALDEWEQLVRAALAETAQAYKRDFLDHPQRFDTFRRATVELLHLLELPGLANVLGRVRHALSWPARQLFAARQAWSLKRARSGGLTHGLGSEEIVLFEAIEKLLTSLERDAARRCDPHSRGDSHLRGDPHPVSGAGVSPGIHQDGTSIPAADATASSRAVWRLVARRLEMQAPALRQEFESAARRQRAAFAPVIHTTANKLYDVLRNKPALLNALRAARITADLAAIALAVKTAGVGMNDLLFAPAMFALTSMLTEGALGSYMTRACDDLKCKQFEHLKAELLDAIFARTLLDLAADLKDETLFGVTAAVLNDVEQALRDWEEAADE